MNRLEKIRQDFGAAQRGVALPPEPGADGLAVLPRSDLAALLAVAEAARPFARCYAPITDEDAQRIVGPCGACGGCQLAAALAPLTEEENRG